MKKFLIRKNNVGFAKIPNFDKKYIPNKIFY